MAIFVLFKNNREKLTDLYNDRIRNFNEIEYINENIFTFDYKYITKLFDEYYNKDINVEEFKHKLDLLQQSNQKMRQFKGNFKNLLENKKMNNEEHSDKDIYFLIESLNKIDNFKYLFENQEILFYEWNNKIKAKDEIELFIDETNNKIAKFNLFNQNSKFITDTYSKDELNLSNENIMNKIKHTKDSLNFVNNYIEVIESLKDMIEKKIFLPNIQNHIAIKNWVIIYNQLTVDNFSDNVYMQFINDFPIFKEYSKVSKLINDYFEASKETLNILILKQSVNSLLEKMLSYETDKLQKEYDTLRKLYLSETLPAEEIIAKAVAYDKKIKLILTNYNKLLSTFDNTIGMLGIEKESEIEDIRDYFLYSVSKSIEKQLGSYGSNKMITKDEVSFVINKIEEKLYKLTNDQYKAIIEAVDILNLNTTGSCLIQGDVSSGKTIVTAALMFILALKNMKSVYVVPRRVLRSQHLKTLKNYNELFEFNLNIYDANDDFDIKNADIVLNGYSFNNKMFKETEFSMGVIDEIQLFGVEQRNSIQKAYPNIDMFYTTATPHPRTKLISLIGNMDIIEIRELPPGRKPKKTEVFTTLLDKHTNLIRSEARKNNMILVVCPLVNKAGQGHFESIKIAHKKYQELFPELRVEKLMANMSDDKKEEIISKSVEGYIDILIATKSIEVGVDIPRATIMIIHYPHSVSIKWGVSQLHQLRGRIGRNNSDSYCFIESPTNIVEGSPIHSVLKTQDVFELTKNDFDWRGFENIIGTRQAGSFGNKADQEKRIKAYEIIAKNTPKVILELESDFIKKVELALENKRIENLN